MKKTFLIFCALYILNSQFSILNGMAQTDSVPVKKHNPKTASWLALIPGAGQIYNKKYWKLPIVYGGLGATAYCIYYYQDLASTYRTERVARLNKDSVNFNIDLAGESDYTVEQNRNLYRRNMEICVAACAIVYALSIVDACVDAHLFYYDVSDNLSMAIRPKINYNPVNRTAAPSLALIVKF
jgi:hypothetical protein